MRIAVAATFVGALCGTAADLRWSGQGVCTLLAAGLIGLAGMRVACAAVDGVHAQMWAMMAGMTGGGLGGLFGSAAAATAAAVLGGAHLQAMDWSMLLMGGGMGGMLGATAGGALPARAHRHSRPEVAHVAWKPRRGA